MKASYIWKHPVYSKSHFSSISGSSKCTQDLQEKLCDFLFRAFIDSTGLYVAEIRLDPISMPIIDLAWFKTTSKSPPWSWTRKVISNCAQNFCSFSWAETFWCWKQEVYSSALLTFKFFGDGHWSLPVMIFFDSSHWHNTFSPNFLMLTNELVRRLALSWVYAQ